MSTLATQTAQRSVLKSEPLCSPGHSYPTPGSHELLLSVEDPGRTGRREGASLLRPQMYPSVPAAHGPVHLMVTTTRQHGWSAHFTHGKTEAPSM